MADPFSEWNKKLNDYLQKKIKERRYGDEGTLRNMGKLLGLGLDLNDKYAREILKKKKLMYGPWKPAGGPVPTGVAAKALYDIQLEAARRAANTPVPTGMGTKAWEKFKGVNWRYLARKPSSGMVWLAVIGILIIGAFFFVTQNALANSLLVGAWNQIKPVFNTQIGGVPLADTWSYLSCVWENSWGYRLVNPASISLLEADTGTDLFEYCKQDLIAAEDIGCTECFRIDAESLNLRVQGGTGQQAVVLARVYAEEDVFCGKGEGTCDRPIAPAVNAKVAITDQDDTEADVKYNYDPEGLLNPKILKSNSLYARGTFDTSKACTGITRAIDPVSKLEYSYATTGEGSIVVRKTLERDPLGGASGGSIVYPGPVKIDIIPDSNTFGGEYVADLYDQAFVNVRFRNAGRGDATITAIELDEKGPEGEPTLRLVECSGPVSVGESADGKSIVQTNLVLGAGERSSTVSCIYDLANAKSSKASKPQYTIVGTVYYDYVLESESNSIIVDCKKTAATGSPGSPGSPGSGDGTQGGDSSCVLPDIDKVCASGSMQDDGCCR